MRYISLCEVHCMGRKIFICCIEVNYVHILAHSVSEVY